MVSLPYLSISLLLIAYRFIHILTMRYCTICKVYRLQYYGDMTKVGGGQGIVAIRVAVLGAAILFSWLMWEALINLAGSRAQNFVEITVAGQEKWMYNIANLTLSHLATLPEVKQISKDSCNAIQTDYSNGQGLFSLMAVGDALGNTLCAVGSPKTAQLPSMADRLYYKKARTADSMVVGEYIVGKLTGRSAINYAYPIKDAQGQFKGLVMLGIDLSWFPKQLVDAAFTGGGDTQVVAVDLNGKTLFAYPPGIKPGEEVVSQQLLQDILSNETSYKLLRGYDGHFRVYAHEGVGPDTDGMILFAGVSLMRYRWIVIIYSALLITGLVLVERNLMMRRKVKKG